MKKLKDKDQPVTSGEFQEFAEFIINTAATKDDLKQLKKELTTSEAIRKIVREEVRPMKEELEEKITEFKDDILTSNDKLVKKLDHFLTEQAAHFVGHRRMDDTLLEHTGDIKTLKHRVTRLEAKAGVV